MLGDGINDSPALSAADAGIAVSEGAQIAREVADITIGIDDLYSLLALKYISDELMKRIRCNYRTIVGFNTGLIILGVAGILQPTTSALLHNTSTLLIGMRSMKNPSPGINRGLYGRKYGYYEDELVQLKSGKSIWRLLNIHCTSH